MSSLSHDFDNFKREADVRSLGAAMYREAARISPGALEDVAAVLTAVASTRNATASEIVDDFAREMVADASQNAYLRAATE